MQETMLQGEHVALSFFLPHVSVLRLGNVHYLWLEGGGRVGVLYSSPLKFSRTPSDPLIRQQ